MMDPFREARACACGDHGFVGLTCGLVAFVSLEDLPLIAGRLWHGCRSKSRLYALSAIEGRNTRMHRLIAGSAHESVDHRDGDGLNNRRENLRGCSHTENARNSKARRAKAVPFKGVEIDKWRFRAAITISGKRHHLGMFGTAETAARAYDAAALQHFGRFARTNVDLGLLPPLAAE